MKKVLPLFVFIDALGWEILRNEPFARFCAPYRRRLTSVFGYSSACVPSIVSGNWPEDHRNWCYFVYDPKNSPFRSLRHLSWLPKTITSRRIFRRWLSKFVKVQLKFRGYFDLYNVPFRHISLFDFTEKRSPLEVGGMNRGKNIFDFLTERKIHHHCSEPTAPEEQNTESLLRDIEREQIDFAFVYWPELDGLMHLVGNDSPEVPHKLLGYEERLQRILELASKHYAEVRLYIFGDHGMANCTEYLDLRAGVNKLGLKMGRDYAVVYDSTMARFWFFNEDARSEITTLLNETPQGRVLPDKELAELRTLFPDRYFGELIYLVKEGVLIVPSDMGERPIKAMHGYHPQEKHSYAALLTNVADVANDIGAIPDMYRLMTEDAEMARSRNAEAPKWQESIPVKEAEAPLSV